MLVIQAISKAVELKADVINASWFVGQDDDIDSAIESASTNGRGGKGVVMVFAAGNDGGKLVYPASLAGCYPVIAVGASNSWDQIKNRETNDHESWISNAGPELTVVAPGVGIVTTDLSTSPPQNGGSYKYDFNGTSSAAPQVSGVAALLLSTHPELTATQVRDRIAQTADKVDGPNRTNRAGWGRLNACRALGGSGCD